MVPDEGRRLQMLRLVRDELSADLEDSDLDGSLNASGHSLMRSRPKSGQVTNLASVVAINNVFSHLISLHIVLFLDLSS